MLVFEDRDERFFVGVGADAQRRMDHHRLATSKISGEAWLIPADDPAAAPRARARRVPTTSSTRSTHWGDRFVVVTNLDAEDFRIMSAPLDAPDEWTELVAHEPGRRITEAEPFADHLADARVARRPDPRCGSCSATAPSASSSSAPNRTTSSIDANPEWTTTTRAASATSRSPRRVERVRRRTCAPASARCCKQTPVPNVDLAGTTSPRGTWATASDGTTGAGRRRAPAPTSTPTARTRAWSTATAPTRSSIAPAFSAARLSLLDRGVVWALVHPRGGGELGRRWYLDGKLLHKRNTFTDTIAVRRAPRRRRGWAAPGAARHPRRLAPAVCSSARASTMRPDLFAAVVAEVPFVDVVTTMSDPTLPLTVTEWEEWGDPRASRSPSYMRRLLAVRQHRRRPTTRRCT